MNFEIMAGGFLVRNTESSWQFFETFATYEFYDRPGVWDGYDNGALHVEHRAVNEHLCQISLKRVI